MSTENLHISDLSDLIRDRVCDQIALFTVGLQRLISRDGIEEILLIGTGTLVIVNGQHCILTAQHVLGAFKPEDDLVLLTSFSGELRRHKFSQLHLQIFHIARGVEDNHGPDIGIIVLPSAGIGNLRAEKSFFNIDKRRERFSFDFIDEQMGFWFTCGIIGESVQQLPSEPGFGEIKGYHGLCGVSTKPIEYDDGDFDYLEIRVSYEPFNPEIPESFGGCSGGGIWQVPLRKTVTGDIEPIEFCLSGVVFYETSITDGVRRLRGHGRKTIYSVVPEFLERTLGS